MHSIPFDFSFSSEGIRQTVFLLGIAYLIGIAIIHLVFARGVWFAANSRRVYFAPPAVWTLATLFGGIFIAAIFWVMHFSPLSPPKKAPRAEA